MCAKKKEYQKLASINLQEKNQFRRKTNLKVELHCRNPTKYFSSAVGKNADLKMKEKQNCYNDNIFKAEKQTKTWQPTEQVHNVC